MPNLLDHRLNTRRGIRRQIAERESLKKQQTVYAERVQALDAEADAAADRHKEICEPLQAELKKLEERVVELTIDRAAIPDSVEARRRELIEELHKANEQLSDATERIARLRKEPAAESQRLRSEVAKGAALEFQLTHADAANPELLLKNFACKAAAEWAGARMKAAEKHVADNFALAKAAERSGDQERARYYRARNEKWQYEAQAAAAAFGQANKEATAAHQAMIDE